MPIASGDQVARCREIARSFPPDEYVVFDGETVEYHGNLEEDAAACYYTLRRSPKSAPNVVFIRPDRREDAKQLG